MMVQYFCNGKYCTIIAVPTAKKNDERIATAIVYIQNCLRTILDILVIFPPVLGRKITSSGIVFFSQLGEISVCWLLLPYLFKKILTPSVFPWGMYCRLIQ